MFQILRLIVLAAGLLVPTLCSHGGASHAPPPAASPQPAEKEEPREHQAR